MKLRIIAAIPLVLTFALVSTSALANDQLVSSVTNSASGPQAVIVNNGVPNGTIQLWYAYTGNAYPCGEFATFNLALQDQIGVNGKSPTYPVELDLAQSGGGTPVQFSPPPDPASFEVTAGSLNNSLVTVSIDCSNLPAPYDGEDIVGNLNQSTNPAGAHLDTISSIQVHIVLSIPDPSACLKLYSFETDLSSGALLNSIGVTQVSKSPGTLNSAANISVDGLVVNTCPQAQAFDMGIGLNNNWQTNPNGNPGQATFVYTESGEVPDPTVSFNLSGFGTGTPSGQALCLPGVTLASGDSYLVTVHSGPIKGTALPSGTSQTGNFAFSASLSTSGSGCSAGAYLPASLVSPSNPAISLLGYSISNYH
jgi:hypothetical protein